MNNVYVILAETMWSNGQYVYKIFKTKVEATEFLRKNGCVPSETRVGDFIDNDHIYEIQEHALL